MPRRHFLMMILRNQFSYLQKLPETAKLYSDRAKVHIQTMNYVAAIADCNRAIQLGDKCFKAYLRKGIAYIKEKRYYSAREVLKTCLHLGYNDSTTCNELIKECDDCIKGNVAETEYNGLEQLKKGTTNRLFIVYDERMCQHRPSSQHDNENPKRIHEILARLEKKDLLRRCGVSSKASPIERKYALEVHDEEYIKFIEMLPLKAKDKAYYKYLPDTPQGRKEFISSAGTGQAVFLAAGAVVEQLVIHWVKTISHGKLVLALEGGCCLDSLAESCAKCVEELLNDRSTQIVKCKYKDADEATWEVISEACSVLGEYWPHLKEVAPFEDEPLDP